MPKTSAAKLKAQKCLNENLSSFCILRDISKNVWHMLYDVLTVFSIENYVLLNPKYFWFHKDLDSKGFIHKCFLWNSIMKIEYITWSKKIKIKLHDWNEFVPHTENSKFGPVGSLI